MDNINGNNNDISKIAGQYKALHNASGADEASINSLDDASLFTLFQKDMEDGYLDGQVKSSNGNESIFNGFSQQVMNNMDDFLADSHELRDAVINELAQDVIDGERVYLWQNPETGKLEHNPKFKNMEGEVILRASEIMSGQKTNYIASNQTTDDNVQNNYINQIMLGLRNAGIDENKLKGITKEDLDDILQKSFKNGKADSQTFINELTKKYNLDEISENARGNFNSAFGLYGENKTNSTDNLLKSLLKYIKNNDNNNNSEIKFGKDFVNKYHDEKSTELENLAKLGYKVLDETAQYSGDWKTANEKSESYKSQIRDLENEIRSNPQNTSLKNKLEALKERYNEHEIARLQIIREENDAVAGKDQTVITRADTPEMVKFKMQRQKFDTKNEAAGYETQLADINKRLSSTSNEYDKRELQKQKTDLEGKLKTAQAKIKNFGGDDNSSQINFVNKYHDAKSSELEQLANKGYNVLDETAVYNKDWREANLKRDELEAQINDINTQAKAHKEKEPKITGFAKESDFHKAKSEWILQNVTYEQKISNLQQQLKQHETQRMQIIRNANASVAGEDRTVITRADSPETIKEKMALQRENVQKDITSLQNQIADINKAKRTSGAFTTKETEELNKKQAELEEKLKSAQERFSKFGQI